MLRLDWASAKAARFACENWHYSGTLPVSKAVRIGVWEDESFRGAVLFSWGANRQLGAPYGLEMTECCELVRVALRSHQSPVSQILAHAMRMLKQQSPGLRLVVSFADPEAGHHGGIYQAGNWIYTGRSSPSFEWRLNGKRLNKRAYTGSNFGKARKQVPAGAKRVRVEGKHRYIMPLDREMRRQVASLARPYPKPMCPGSIELDAPPDQGGEGS